MRKIIVSIILIGVSVFYIYSRKPAPESVPVVSTPTTNVITNGTAQPTTRMMPMMGVYRDGTYTGSVADALYGLVQVTATIQNGTITDVAFLSYPSDRSTSRFINSRAMPMLKQEAITAQSANVDMVSGATNTSRAFKESLAAALAAAKN